MAKDILQDANGDILLVNGDIVYGKADNQYLRLIALSNKGDFKRAPLAGVGMRDFLDDETPRALYAETSRQVAADGATLNRISYDYTTNELHIDGDY